MSLSTRIVSKILPLTLSIVVTLLATNSYSEVRINGFGNFVFGMVGDDQDSAFGYDDLPDFNNESLFGVQLTSDLSDGLSATAQIVARGADDFESEFAWAYLSYNLSDQSNIKFGRLRIPFYNYSEYVEVGYAYHWIRAPYAVYSLGFNNVDGVNYTYSSYIGGFDTEFQFLFGRYNGIASPGGIDSQSDLRNFSSLAYALNDGTWSFRVAYTSCGECVIDTPFESILGFDLIGALNANGFSSVANDIVFDGDSGAFMNFAWKYNAENFFVEGEFGRLDVDNTFLPTTDSGYVSAGIRQDAYTWYMNYDWQDADAKTDIYAALPDSGIFPPTAAVVGLIQSTTTDESAITLGMRYDFHPSAAFNLEFTRFDEQAGTSSIVDGTSLVSAALSFVF